MNRSLYHAAFAIGLLVVAWVGAGYVPGSPLALLLVLLITAFYLMGALELHRFGKTTRTLDDVVEAARETPADLESWLSRLPVALEHAVRLRVEGQRVPMPGPALTPYLAGLLVLLGMLGTFLGMVVTLQGTGVALERANDVEAIRASLVAPVKGLGLAFGTSVAGVAASAMLGLMSALVRRERQRVGQRLDARIATTLRVFSRTHQREESLRLLRVQAEAMPALVTQLQALVAQAERQGQVLHERVLSSQTEFHESARRAYTGLAESVDHSLKASLSESARLAAAAIEPAVQATMAGLAREGAALRDSLSASVNRQLDGMARQLDSTTGALAGRWQTALDEQQRHMEAVAQDLRGTLDGFAQAFDERSGALVNRIAARMDDSASQWSGSWSEALAQHRDHNEALMQRTREGWSEAMSAMTAALRDQSRQDAAAMTERQQQICTTLEHTAQAVTAQAESHARATIDEISRLVQLASEAPRAAAEVIGELRGALSESLVRDNAALEERNRLMTTLGSLLDAVNHAGSEQRAAIDALVRTTDDLLERAGERFADAAQAGAASMQSAAAQVTASAAEVASLGEGFGVAVQLFSQASEKLTAQLQGIESALGHSLARSDEQIAYYVAQARELIDLTLGSQKQIVDELQQLAAPNAGAAPAANAASQAAA